MANKRLKREQEEKEREQQKKKEPKEIVKDILQILLIAALLCVPLSLIALNAELIVGDEIWNFQNISKMINGGTMYVNCNIIVTPIFYLIGYCFVKLITSTIFGFRVYNIVIFLALLLSSFGIFRSLKIDKLKSCIYTLLVFLFTMPYISVGANYNVLAEVIYILGIVLFLNKNKLKLYDIWQGIVIFACIFTKQNIGLYYLLSIIVSEIVIDGKESIHYIVREFAVTLVCSLIGVIIMCITGCFSGFLNYAILGMGEFTTGNFSLQEKVGIVVIGFLVIALFSYVLSFLLSKINKELADYLKVLCVFSIFLNISVMPIINLYHASFAILLNVIIFAVIFENLLFNKLKNKVVLGIIVAVLYCAISGYGVMCFNRASNNIKIEDKDNIYYSVNISEELNNKLKEVTDYIKTKEEEGTQVICITSDAPLYMTYLNKNHSELDLCFKGNLGYQGEEKTIEKVSEMENVEILMNKEIYWQELEDLRMYVIENFENIGNMQDVLIYKTN